MSSLCDHLILIEMNVLPCFCCCLLLLFRLGILLLYQSKVELSNPIWFGLEIEINSILSEWKIIILFESNGFLLYRRKTKVLNLTSCYTCIFISKIKHIPLYPKYLSFLSSLTLHKLFSRISKQICPFLQSWQTRVSKSKSNDESQHGLAQAFRSH